MAENYIVIGDNDYTLNGDNIIDLTINRSNSLMLEEMSSDMCEAKVYGEDDFLNELAYGTKIQIFRDFSLQDTFYLSKVTRINKYQYKMEMTSFFGILDNELFYGGYYTGERFQAVVESIIKTNGLDPTTSDHADVLSQIEYDNGVADLPVYGWIKVVSKREALHQVLFSKGISLKRSSGGIITFSTVYDTEPIPISDSYIYEDNDVRFLPNVSDIEVEENTYGDDTNLSLQVLFENKVATQQGKSYVAVYNVDSPVLRTVVPSGLTILYRNCNAALVSGVGTIRGYPSVHSTTIIKEKIRETVGDTVSIRGCSMITLANSAFIMDRLKSYYLSAETEVSTDIVKTDQRTGSHVSVVNSFGDRVSGFITNMRETYSGIVKASCKVITGYEPVEPPTGYWHSVLLTGNSGWVVPASVYLKDVPKVKVVLIGGGTGGYSGLAGETGEKPATGAVPTNYASGGSGGQGGSGGKIYEFEITNPANTLYFSCGSGGSGGAICSSQTTSNSGSAGSATTITSGSTTYSSESGSRRAEGIANMLTGMRYGTSRENTLLPQFQSGASGALCMGESQIELPILIGNVIFDTTTNPPSYSLVNSVHGQKGQDATGRYYHGSQNYYTGNARGGAGGGGAAGTTGGNGSNGRGIHAEYGNTAGWAGKGGTGATPSIIPPKPNQLIGATMFAWDDGMYGTGGFGGYGGGGGGSGGRSTYVAVFPQAFLPGDGGSGGNGGRGGSGADGCIIVYY